MATTKVPKSVRIAQKGVDRTIDREKAEAAATAAIAKWDKSRKRDEQKLALTAWEKQRKLGGKVALPSGLTSLR